MFYNQIMENLDVLDVGTVCGLVTLTHQVPVEKDGRRRGNWWVGKCSCGSIVGPYTAAHWRKKIRSCRLCKYGNRQSLRKSGTHNTARKVWNNYISSARGRRIGWHLQLNDFMDEVVKPCAYCGRTNTSYFNATQDWEERFEYTGLDRVDASKAYEKGNVVPCCKVCNMAKSNMSLKEFYEWIDALTKHRRP